MNRKKCFLAVVLVGSGLLAGCAKGEDRNEINIGYFNNVTHPQALLMKSEQMLETELGADVEVNWTAFNAGPAEVEALFAEDIDIGFIGPGPAISANVKSVGDVQILTGATKGGAILVKSESAQIDSISDLDGKNVAIPQIGNTQHLCLLHLLGENGLSPVSEGGTVNVVAVTNADVANLMDRGDVDAAFVPEPWGATLLEQGAQIVLDYDEVFMDGQYDVAVIVVRKEFLEKNPELVEAFLKVHDEASIRIVEDKEKSLEIINTELQNATGKSLSETVIEEAFRRIIVDTELNKESIMGFAGMSEEEGFIDEAPPEQNLFVQ